MELVQDWFSTVYTRTSYSCFFASKMSSLPPVSASIKQAVVLASRFHGKFDVRDRCLFKRRTTKMRARLIIGSYITLAMNTRIPTMLVLYQVRQLVGACCLPFLQPGRLERKPFTYICDMLKPTTMKHNTRFRRAKSVEKELLSLCGY